MLLAPGPLAALRNPADKQAGADVGWINIADALSLTQEGLAERSREGWKITPAGVDALKLQDAPGDPPGRGRQDGVGQGG